MKFFLLAFVFSIPTYASTFVPDSFSAHFEESIKSKATGKEKKSFGQIDYQYPSQIHFEVTKPNPSTFVSNKVKSWYYVPPFINGEEGQVTIQKSSKLPLTKFLDSMKKGLKDSKLFTHQFKDKILILNFVPAVQKDLTLKEVHFESKKAAKDVKKMSEFEKMTLIYVDGRKVNLKFLDFKENVKFNSNHFDFKIPAKTKVNEN